MKEQLKTTTIQIAFVAAIIALACYFGGCCNINTRSRSTKKTGPVLCAPHPYYCTKGAFEILGAPFAENHYDPIGDSLVILTYPVWIVSAAFDVALDTAFILVDGITWAVMSHSTDATKDNAAKEIVQETER